MHDTEKKQQLFKLQYDYVNASPILQGRALVALLNACRQLVMEGDKDSFAFLVNNGFHLPETTTGMHPPLMVQAADKGDLNLVDFFYSAYATNKVACHHALLAAIASGHVHIVQYLLEKGVKANDYAQDRNGGFHLLTYTIIHAQKEQDVILAPYQTIIENLIAHGANILHAVANLRDNISSRLVSDKLVQSLRQVIEKLQNTMDADYYQQVMTELECVESRTAPDDSAQGSWKPTAPDTQPCEYGVGTLDSNEHISWCAETPNKGSLESCVSGIRKHQLACQKTMAIYKRDINGSNNITFFRNGDEDFPEVSRKNNARRILGQE